MSKKDIYVFDDEASLKTQYKKRLERIEAINDLYNVHIIDDEIFEKEIQIILERQREVRRTGKWNGKSIFDDVSILFIDYDLIKALKSPSYITGEIVAYLARCFSKCGIIIGLNQFGRDPFDLTLKGRLDSYCDLNIGSKQMYNPGLWSDDKIEFRPWYWPVLPSYLEKFEKKVKNIKKDVKGKIFEVIGLSEFENYLPKSVSEFIKTKQVSTTFEWFVKNSGSGLRGRRDKKATEDMIARISAARLTKWVERYIVQGQDIVVDAPHLITRYPSLLKNDGDEIEAWNQTTYFKEPKNLGIDYKRIERHRLKNDEWFSRPVWSWRGLMDEHKIDEVRSPWEKKISDYVFCEDASSFYDREDCRQFTCGLDSPFVYRYLKYFKGVEYRPRVRLF